MSTKLIIGLGNPGSKYQGTRHNAGFLVLDHLAQQMGIQITRKNFSGLYGEGSWHGGRLFLLKPQTFMNLSGRSAAEAVRFHKLSIDDLLVVHDDLDIPFGRLKFKEGGGHGGHNGLRSLIQELGGAGFTRLKVGVGRPLQGDASDHVLSNFSREESLQWHRILDGAFEAIQLLLSEGLPKAMSLCNNRDYLGC